jgi:hypothetical protein
MSNLRFDSPKKKLNYPPVVKHGNGKSTIHSITCDFPSYKPPFIEDYRGVPNENP